MAFSAFCLMLSRLFFPFLADSRPALVILV
jgi:hypothetical protein